MDLNSTLPAAVSGLPVVAMVKLPDTPGMLPHRHVVVCEVEAASGDDRSFVLWVVAWNAGYNGGQWTVTSSGRYDLPFGRALDLMVQRAKGVTA